MTADPPIFYATVLSTSGPGAVTLSYRGTVHPGVRIPPWYSAPQRGDRVLCVAVGDSASQVVEVISVSAFQPGMAGGQVAQGATGGGPSVNVTNSFSGTAGLAQIGTVYASSDGSQLELVRSTAVTSSTSTLVVPALANGGTGSYYTSAGAWATDASDRPVQGQMSLGPSRGVWFYGGGAFSALSGKTVSRIQVSFTRVYLSSSDPAPKQPCIGMHSNATRPVGDVTTATTSQQLGQAATGLTVGENASYDLPVTWGQMLAAGTALGLYAYTPGPASALMYANFSDDPTSGQLTITYS
jgi:hypothetical protein